MWKHSTSSLWTNTTNFIFCLLHIVNLPLLVVLTPFCSPCIPVIDCAHSFPNCDYTFANYTNFYDDSTNKSGDCVKAPMTQRILLLIQPIFLTDRL
jgi:hypothetical protein